MPDIPCAAPFAAALPGAIQLRLPAAAAPAAGFGPMRLLLRCRGSFILDQALSTGPARPGSKSQKVGATPVSEVSITVKAPGSRQWPSLQLKAADFLAVTQWRGVSHHC